MVLVPLSVNLEVWQKSSDLNTDGQKFGVDLFIGNCKHFFLEMMKSPSENSYLLPGFISNSIHKRGIWQARLLFIVKSARF